jgi:hypothetical protein
MESLIRAVLALICLSTIYVSPANSSTDLSSLSEGLDRAVSWLATQQNVDGSFGKNTDRAIQWQASHEVLTALSVTGDLSLISSETLIAWYGLQGIDSTEFLSRATLTGSALGGSENYLIQLIDNSNVSGGFGSYSQDGSNVYDTAFALRALSKHTDNSAAKVYASIEYIRSQQQDDGGFQLKGNLSSEVLTAYVLISLQPYLFQYDVANLVNRTQNYLLDFLQNEENLESVNQWQLSLILLSVIPLTTDTSLYMNAVEQLIQGQDDDGSWQQDVYSTALATQLIQRLTTIDQAPVVVTSRVKGRVIDSVTQQALNFVTVSIDGAEVSTDIEGRFEFIELEAGTYNVQYSADGYYDATQTIEIVERSIFDVGTVELSVVPTTAIIEGVVTDRETTAPLAGVQVTVTGSITTSITTDVSGYYRFVVDPEVLIISVEKTGYLALTATAELDPGASAKFSPQMMPEAEQPVIETTIKGNIVDSVSGASLAGVRVLIMDSSGNNLSEVNSDINGFFEVPDAPDGTLHIEFTLADYQTVNANIVASTGSVIELTTIQMTSEITMASNTISGRVTDAGNTEGIPNVKLQLQEINYSEGQAGRSVTTYTDSHGNYSLENIEFNQMEVFVQATGYISYLTTLNYSEAGMYEVDFTLSPYISEGVEITALSTDKELYPAYEDVSMNVTLNNKGSAAKRVFIQANIVNDSGQSVQYLMLGESDETGAVDSITILPDTPIEVAGEWNTGTTPPGNYQVVLTVFDNLSGQVLTQNTFYFVIEPSGSIESVTALISPRISKVDAIKTLNIVYQIKYLGNQIDNYTLEYRLIDPDDEIALNNSTEVELKPSDFNKTINFQEENYHFNTSGRYLFESDVIDQQINIEPSWITVAPSTRVEVEQRLTPLEILPGNDRQLNIEILLQGVEQP